MNCLFCKIIKGEIPSRKVYEDETLIAFLDVNPVNPGHVLLVPKNHSANLLGAPGEDLRNLISRVPNIANAIMEGLGYEGFNLIVNNNDVAGQEVNHLHFHIIPRKEGDGFEHWKGKEYGEGEMDEVMNKIIKKIK